jgi:Domain of unknown function (DUF5615)
MRFLVDANLPLSVAPLIRALGHEATDVREIAMGNADDGVIARHARENAFCLITRDKDFGDIRNYPPGDYGGVISARCHSSRFHESAHGAFDLFWRRRPIANTDSDHRSSMPG